jgi:hypothetical protein
MPEKGDVEKRFEQARNTTAYVKRWKLAQNRQHPLMTKWARHIEEKNES